MEEQKDKTALSQNDRQKAEQRRQQYVFEDPKSDRGSRVIEIISACSSLDEECKSILDDDSISDDNEDEMIDLNNSKNRQTR